MFALRCVVLILTAILLCPAGSMSADQATVFIYHRFGDSRYPSTNTTLREFRNHLDLLRQGGYQVLPLVEIVERLRAGRELPERCVAITVDDAFRSFLHGAMPLLREYGMPATLFVNPGELGGPDYLNWDELRGLTGEGIDIGNHSSGHGYLLDRRGGESLAAWRERIRSDILRAQQELTYRLGAAPKLFAYPYGEFNRDLQNIVRELGFLGALGQQSGVMGRGQDLFALPRFPAAGEYAALDRFRERLSFRSLHLSVLAPEDVLIDDSENPPVWRVTLDLDQIEPRTLRCYVPGQRPAQVRVVDAASGIFEIQAVAALTGRRSKYTLTAADRQGRWYWYSQLWVRPGP